MEPVKINSLELENVKRVKAVKFEPSANGLTIVGGNNMQGKSSVLDAISWALGGNKFQPTEPNRQGSVNPPMLKITLSNGLIVERKGKNSTLYVTDPKGEKAGQKLLDSFVEEFALNLPKFMEMKSLDKAKTLLEIIGVEQQLIEFQRKEESLYQERLLLGREKERKQKYAEELESFENVPEVPIEISELIKQQQEILAKNGENQRARNNLKQNEQYLENVNVQIADLKKKLEGLENEKVHYENLVIQGRKDTAQLEDESTEELENSIRNSEEINSKIRKNLEKNKAMEDATQLANQYEEFTQKIDKVRKDKFQLIKNAELPLEGLSVNDQVELTYKGMPWDNMSGAEQLIVATAIVRKLNPNCGFVLMDKLEQMDLDTLKVFGEWLEKENLQVIATRVSKGEECQIIIEDGYSETPGETLNKNETKAELPKFELPKF